MNFVPVWSLTESQNRSDAQLVRGRLPLPTLIDSNSRTGVANFQDRTTTWQVEGPPRVLSRHDFVNSGAPVSRIESSQPASFPIRGIGHRQGLTEDEVMDDEAAALPAFNS